MTSEMKEACHEVLRRMYDKIDADIDFDEDREKFKVENQEEKPIYQKYELPKEIQSEIISEVSSELRVDEGDLAKNVHLGMPSPKFSEGGSQ